MVDTFTIDDQRHVQGCAVKLGDRSTQKIPVKDILVRKGLHRLISDLFRRLDVRELRHAPLRLSN